MKSCQIVCLDGTVLCGNKQNLHVNTRVTTQDCLQCGINPTISSLVDIEHTLPPHKDGRDRKLTFEADGSITYEQEDDPPRDINGYKRDPDNPWHFIPLWPECKLRHGTGVRYANCGCIDIIMRCSNPDTVQFGNRVSHEQCQNCQGRKP